jgi:hypothetical protein
MVLGWPPSKNVYGDPVEEISIFSNDGHLGWRAGLSDTILKGTHPGTIPARIGLIWFCGFRGEDLNAVNISHFNLLFINHLPKCNQTLVDWSMVDPFPKLFP